MGRFIHGMAGPLGVDLLNSLDDDVAAILQGGGGVGGGPGSDASAAAAADAAQAAQVSTLAALEHSADAALAEFNARQAELSMQRFYPGQYAADPLTRIDGSARQVGDMAFVATVWKRWSGSAWVSIAFDPSVLAAAGGAGLLGFDGSLNYTAGTLGAQFFGRINIKSSPWNCKCDGVTDDAPGFWAAVAFAQTKGYKIIHPGGVCRITYGYNQATARGNIIFEGNGRGDASQPQASIVLLDSSSPSSYFLNLSARSILNCDGMTFKCAQVVADRAFFKFTSSLYSFFFSRCNFEDVERPIVFGAGSYFQNGSLRDVQFAQGGTIHSECPTAEISTSLVGTFLLLSNVNHEGTVTQANTEKIVCNLTGIRRVSATNLLFEGTLPEAGWTILKLSNPHDAYYTRASFAGIKSLHSEWSGVFQPLYVVDQVGGTVKISEMFGISTISKYKLSSLGRVIFEETSFAGTTDEPSTMFLLETAQCTVDFLNCGIRNLVISKPGFNHFGSQYASTTNGIGQIILSNTAPQAIYRYAGGIPDAEGIVEAWSTGSGAPSTDATYGRKHVFTPASGALNTTFRITSAVFLLAGDQVVLCVKARLPTFVTGLWRFNLNVDGVEKTAATFDSSYSGLIVDVFLPWVLLAAPSNYVGAGFSHGSAGTVSGTLEILSLVLYHGNSVPRREVPLYPRNITTANTVIPTTGTWKAGDRMLKSNPAVGAPKGWICTASGSPGTWVSEGNL